MCEKVLMKGNEAIAEAAIRAGCTAYFGYPITPQNEIIAYMAREMLARGRVFIQAESEVGAINMVFGASAAGARAMTSSSSPGMSLKQEGISYAAGADIPCVIVNIVRGGPGLGSIAPSQADYFQATRGGGHGDYYCIVLAPQSVQECADFSYEAFDLSDKYRVPVIIQADGLIGQMVEPVELPPEKDLNTRGPGGIPARNWAVGNRTGSDQNRESRHLTSIYIAPEELEAAVKARFLRYEEIKKNETRYESVGIEDADLILAAYGTSARICMGARKLAAQKGIKLGVFRPVTLWPFPYAELGRATAGGKNVLTVEMSMGQFIEDVKLSILESGNTGPLPKVHFLGHLGGVIPTEEEVFAAAEKICRDNRS